MKRTAVLFSASGNVLRTWRDEELYIDCTGGIGGSRYSLYRCVEGKHSKVATIIVGGGSLVIDTDEEV